MPSSTTGPSACTWYVKTGAPSTTTTSYGRELAGQPGPLRREEAGERGMVLGEAAPARQRADPHRRARPLRQPDRLGPGAVAVDAGPHHDGRPSAGRQRRRPPPAARSGSPTNSPSTAPHAPLARRLGVPVVLGDRHERRVPSAVAWRRGGRGRCAAGTSSARAGSHAPLHVRLREGGRLLGEEVRLGRQHGPGLLARRDHERRAVRIAVKMLPRAWPTPTALCRLTNAALRRGLGVARRPWPMTDASCSAST